MLLLLVMMMSIVTDTNSKQYSLSQACGCQCVDRTRPEDGGGNCKTAYRGRLWCYTEDISGSVYCKDATKSNKLEIMPFPSNFDIIFVLPPAMPASTGPLTPASPPLWLTSCARLW